MARKRNSNEDIMKLLREIQVHFYSGMDVQSAYRAVGVSNPTYYDWFKKFGSMGHSTLRYAAIDRNNEDELRLAMIRQAKQYGQYGYRNITQLLRIEAWHVNHSQHFLRNCLPCSA